MSGPPVLRVLRASEKGYPTEQECQEGVTGAWPPEELAGLQLAGLRYKSTPHMCRANAHVHRLMNIV